MKARNFNVIGVKTGVLRHQPWQCTFSWYINYPKKFNAVLLNDILKLDNKLKLSRPPPPQAIWQSIKPITANTWLSSAVRTVAGPSEAWRSLVTTEGCAWPGGGRSAHAQGDSACAWAGWSKIPCNYCAKQLGIRVQRKHHMNKHLELKPYTCTKCVKVCSKPTHHSVHRQIHKGLHVL